MWKENGAIQPVVRWADAFGGEKPEYKEQAGQKVYVVWLVLIFEPWERYPPPPQNRFINFLKFQAYGSIKDRITERA